MSRHLLLEQKRKVFSPGLGVRCVSGPTWIVGLSFQDLQLSAFSQGVLQTKLQKASLGPAHPLQQGEQSHGLFALVPSLKPAGQHAHLIAKHHGLRGGMEER